jgi:hypothetical protein
MDGRDGKGGSGSMCSGITFHKSEKSGTIILSTTTDCTTMKPDQGEAWLVWIRCTLKRDRVKRQGKEKPNAHEEPTGKAGRMRRERWERMTIGVVPVNELRTRNGGIGSAGADRIPKGITFTERNDENMARTNVERGSESLGDNQT